MVFSLLKPFIKFFAFCRKQSRDDGEENDFGADHDKTRNEPAFDDPERREQKRADDERKHYKRREKQSDND